MDVLVTDALRVAAVVPVFAYASYLDIKQRRVPHRTWLPLVAVAVVAFVGDLFLRDPHDVVGFAFLSLALGVVFGYGFYYLGTFGGADRYALVVIAGVFPIYPFFGTPLGEFPVVVPELPVFILSVLGNTVLVGIAYPAKLLVFNAAARSTRNPALAALAKRVDIDDLHDEFGRVLGGDEDVSLRGSGVFSGGGVGDIDFVRDYVEWRGVGSLAEVRGEDLRLEEFVDETQWMTDDIEDDARDLRELAAYDAVWISPGIPFIVPMLVGLLIALTAGDMLFAAMRAVFGV